MSAHMSICRLCLAGWIEVPSAVTDGELAAILHVSSLRTKGKGCIDMCPDMCTSMFRIDDSGRP